MSAARLLATVALLPLFATAAKAELMRATSPGVMCKSTAALARLSLPDGSSRTGLASPVAG